MLEHTFHEASGGFQTPTSGRTDVVEIAFELAGFEEITRWILSWGSLAEVISPKSLRDHVAKEIAGAAKRYR